jgi:flavin reductase (DIM6/NTAB) family NADH-FMN oxidoreductase RutF
MSGSIAALFQRLTQGVYVVGVARGETRNAFTAAWVMQVSYDPLLLALSINANHSSYRLIKEGRSFTVNVLKKGQLSLADHYGRSARTHKMALTDWANDRTGPPLLREGLAWFECKIVDEHPVGDHVLVVARVIDGKLVGLGGRAHVLPRNRRNGWCLYSLSRRFRRGATHLRASVYSLVDSLASAGSRHRWRLKPTQYASISCEANSYEHWSAPSAAARQ